MLKWAARTNKQPTHIFLRQNVNNDKPGVIQIFSVIKYVSNFSISAPLELVKRFFRHTVHKSLILSANVRHLWIRMIHYDDISSKLKGKVMCQVVWLIHRVSLLSAITFIRNWKMWSRMRQNLTYFYAFFPEASGSLHFNEGSAFCVVA